MIREKRRVTFTTRNSFTRKNFGFSFYFVDTNYKRIWARISNSNVKSHPLFPPPTVADGNPGYAYVHYRLFWKWCSFHIFFCSRKCTLLRMTLIALKTHFYVLEKNEKCFLLLSFCLCLKSIRVSQLMQNVGPFEKPGKRRPFQRRKISNNIKMFKICSLYSSNLPSSCFCSFMTSE